MLVVVFCSSHCAGYMLYVSPGNFYQTGELPVDVVTIPSTAPVALDIYSPTQPARYPVIVFQHGFGGSIKAYETISEHLASHGFVVILPQMYGPGISRCTHRRRRGCSGFKRTSWLEDNLNDYIPVYADTSLLGIAGHSRGGQVAYRITLQVLNKSRHWPGLIPLMPQKCPTIPV